MSATTPLAPIGSPIPASTSAAAAAPVSTPIAVSGTTTAPIPAGIATAGCVFFLGATTTATATIPVSTPIVPLSAGAISPSLGVSGGVVRIIHHTIAEVIGRGGRFP